MYFQTLISDRGIAPRRSSGEKLELYYSLYWSELTNAVAIPFAVRTDGYQNG